MLTKLHHIGIVGTGLIGASLIERLVTLGDDLNIIVYDVVSAHAEFVAGQHQQVSVAQTLQDLQKCDCVFVCTPVATIADQVVSLARIVSDHAIIVDTGSTKHDIVNTVRNQLPDFDRFIPGHPIAGSHETGPETANAAIFNNRPFVLTPYETTDSQAVATITDLMENAGMRVFCVPLDDHDPVLAATSHLPHLIAFALNDQFDASGLSPTTADALIAGSFRQMTTLAASDPTMWSDVFLANREEMLSSISRIKSALDLYEQAIQNCDDAKLKSLIEASRTRRRRLDIE